MKYKIVRQYSEEDCGAACIASIARYYQRVFALNRVREIVGTGQLGTTLLGLRRGAQFLGFEAKSVKTFPQVIDRLDEIPLPAIIHWQGRHWVVLYGKRQGKYIIGDPATDIRYLSREELLQGWKNWVMLILEPDPERFYQLPSDRPGGVSRFVKPLLRYKLLIFTVFACAIVTGLLSLASPFLWQILTDDVIVRGDLGLLIKLIVAVVVIYVFSTILQLIQENLIANFAQQYELGLTLDFGRQILRLPLTYYETHRSGEIVSRLQDIQEINQLILQIVVGLPSQLFTALVAFGLMLLINGSLTILAVVVAIAMNLTTLVFLPTLQQKIRRALVLEAENQGILVESFKGALTLKTTTALPQFWSEFQMRFGRLANLNLRTIQISIINDNFSDLVANIGSILLLGFGSTLVMKQSMSIGQLIAFTGMNRNFFGFITTCVGLVNKFLRTQTASQRLTEVIDTTPETKDELKKHHVKLGDRGNIEIESLTFYYPGQPKVLADLSLTIPGGVVTALIGTSGCGKSTLAKTLAGLYLPQAGNIAIDGYNLQELLLDCLRQQVVLVPQEAHFWSRSIYDNFILGAPEITFSDIVAACRLVEADSFINRLPDKYETVLGEFGSNLSGGQRQRLALARAIVRNPPVLILDESTSGLDPYCEAQVLDRLLAYRRGKTTILISHRPQVVIKADWLVFLEQGQLKMVGTVANFQSQPGEHLNFITPFIAQDLNHN
jgi:ATP-binding cassette, subfamily C, bacterial